MTVHRILQSLPRYYLNDLRYDNCMGTMKVNEKSNDDSTVDVTVNWVQINKRLSNPRLFIEESVKEMPAWL